MSIITISSAPGAGATYFAAVIARAEAASGAKVAWIGGDGIETAIEGVSAVVLSEMDGTETFDLVVVDSGDQNSVRVAALVAKRVLLIGEAAPQPS
jgi:hypothetical protein